VASTSIALPSSAIAPKLMSVVTPPNAVSTSAATGARRMMSSTRNRIGSASSSARRAVSSD
jgi:hypothetical protein